MKKCIWCSKTEESTSFKKQAHTIPKSIGGKKICENVCDQCNAFFGQYNNKLPPIETVLKETFNISRVRLAGAKHTGKNKAIPKPSSIYFNIDLQNHKIGIKGHYKRHTSFQENIARQMKKGIYKIFLEETERQFGNGHDSKFDFIREFSRYDLGDYPVFYFQRRIGVIFFSEDWITNPELILVEGSPMQYLIHEPGFVEFELFGHVIGIAVSRHWNLLFDNYKKKTVAIKQKHFSGFKSIEYFSDFDLTLQILDDPQ